MNKCLTLLAIIFSGCCTLQAESAEQPSTDPRATLLSHVTAVQNRIMPTLEHKRVTAVRTKLTSDLEDADLEKKRSADFLSSVTEQVNWYAKLVTSLKRADELLTEARKEDAQTEVDTKLLATLEQRQENKQAFSKLVSSWITVSLFEFMLERFEGQTNVEDDKALADDLLSRKVNDVFQDLQRGESRVAALKDTVAQSASALSASVSRGADAVAKRVRGLAQYLPSWGRKKEKPVERVVVVKVPADQEVEDDEDKDDADGVPSPDEPKLVEEKSIKQKEVEFGQPDRELDDEGEPVDQVTKVVTKTAPKKVTKKSVGTISTTQAGTQSTRRGRRRTTTTITRTTPDDATAEDTAAAATTSTRSTADTTSTPSAQPVVAKKDEAVSAQLKAKQEEARQQESQRIAEARKKLDRQKALFNQKVRETHADPAKKAAWVKFRTQRIRQRAAITT